MQSSYNGIAVPTDGQPIEYVNNTFKIPDHPIIPFIEGDGTGRDIWKASQRVFDAAVEKAYGGKRSVKWFEVLAGEKAYRQTQNWLPDDTVKATVDFRVSIKGPLTTPVGGGIRSLNVALRQLMDLYQCVRPVKYYAGVPSPVKHPEKLDVVIFRENTEDIYAGIEFRQGTPEADKFIAFVNDDMLKGTKKKIRLEEVPALINEGWQSYRKGARATSDREPDERQKYNSDTDLFLRTQAATILVETAEELKKPQIAKAAMEALADAKPERTSAKSALWEVKGKWAELNGFCYRI